jgi:hypothetical protein
MLYLSRMCHNEDFQSCPPHLLVPDRGDLILTIHPYSASHGYAATIPFFRPQRGETLVNRKILCYVAETSPFSIGGERLGRLWWCEIKFLCTGSVTTLLKIAAFGDIAPCSHVVVVQCFRGAYCLHYHGDDAGFIALMMEAVCTSETSVCYNETTWRNISEGCNIHTCHHDNLKSE